MYKKDWIGQWAVFTPGKRALIEYDTGRSITYGALNEKANYLAQLLWETRGIRKGDRIMVLSEHCIEYVVLFSVAQKAGITLVPVNYRLAVPEIDYLIQNSGPKLLLAERKFQNKVSKLQNQVSVHWMEDLRPELEHCPGSKFSPVSIEEDHPLFILYTSGTTGFPKGVIYSHKMLFWNSINTTQSLSITSDDHTITCMPPFHTGGWNVLLTPMLHRGASVGLLKKFDADLILKLIDREKIALFMGVPTMLKMMSQSDNYQKTSLRSLRYLVVGGEALSLEVIDRWHRKGVKIRQGYGLTEVGPNITSLHQEDAERKIGSIGRANFYVEHKIVDDLEQPVGINEIGEFCLKGPMVTPGYWQNQKATDQTLRNGWLHTGDLVKEDEEGFLYVVARKKNMFISGGENVYPAEVERVIRQLKGVDEAAVIGVSDDKWGEVGKAFVVLADPPGLSEEDLRNHCSNHLANFKVPKYFRILSELPKNDSGKIDRKNLIKVDV